MSPWPRSTEKGMATTEFGMRLSCDHTAWAPTSDPSVMALRALQACGQTTFEFVSLVILFISQYIILSGPRSTTDAYMENSRFAALGPRTSQ
jgi:hypothetical protein